MRVSLTSLVVFLTLTFSDGRCAHVHISWLDPRKESRPD